MALREWERKIWYWENKSLYVVAVLAILALLLSNMDSALSYFHILLFQDFFNLFFRFRILLPFEIFLFLCAILMVLYEVYIRRKYGIRKEWWKEKGQLWLWIIMMELFAAGLLWL